MIAQADRINLLPAEDVENALPVYHPWRHSTELFRKGEGARAWGTLIVRGEMPGSYRLAVVDGVMPSQPDAIARLERQVRRLRRDLRRRQPDALAVVVQLVEALKGLMAQKNAG